MDGWPLWDVEDAKGLASYVQVGDIAPAVAARMPGPSDRPVLDVLAEIYRNLADLGIAYVHEPVTSVEGAQAIRCPAEVLGERGSATCVDVSLVFAAACLEAGLHPMAVALDTADGEGHVLVAVWLGGGGWYVDGPDPDYPYADGLHPQPPRGLTAGLADGTWAAIDVVGLTVDGERPAVPFERALTDGAAALTDGYWRWRAGVDLAVVLPDARIHRPPRKPARPPLTPGYQPPLKPGPGIVPRPLTDIAARSGLVPFYESETYRDLRDWCLEGGNDLRVALVEAVGGAGKTRLAAHLCERLEKGNGWHTGFLRYGDRTDDATRDEGLEWLAGRVGPLLIVVDYPEAAKTGTVAALFERFSRRTTGPTRVLLTGRNTESWWRANTAELRPEHTVAGLYRTRLDPVVARPGSFFRTAVRRFSGTEPPGEIPAQIWGTTLELAMLAWVTAHGGRSPETATELRRDILDAEFRYWLSAIWREDGDGNQVKVRTRTLTRVAAALALLGPTPERLDEVLAAAVPSGTLRETIAEAIERIIAPDPETGALTLRPDPVADHLVAEHFAASSGRELFTGLIRIADAAEQQHACLIISRGADQGTASLAAAALEAVPELWEAALPVVGASGGPFQHELEELAVRADTPMDLSWLAVKIPRGNMHLQRLAVIAIMRCDVPGDTDAASRAEWLHLKAQRLHAAGIHEPAEAAVREAVAILREFGPPEQSFALSDAIGTLSSVHTARGRHDLALTAAVEVMHLVSGRAESDSQSHLLRMADAYIRLGSCLAEVGRHEEALRAGESAVRMLRRLAETDPGAHRRNLAAALSNLGNRLTASGRHREAREAVEEAVSIHRDLSLEDPATRLPDLAIALNNLGAKLSTVGEHEKGLEATREAAAIRRRMALTDPAYLPDLARSLVSLGIRYKTVRAVDEGLASLEEGIGIQRVLAVRDPDTHLPTLALALINLGDALNGAGRLQEALAAAEECLGHFRDLASLHPAVYNPNVATALHQRGTILANLGRHEEALTDLLEALDRWRESTGPSRLLPRDYGGTLTVITHVLAELGRGDEARAAAEEAVTVFRRLAETSPEAYTTMLADALARLAEILWASGFQTKALATYGEAATHYRASGTDPNAHAGVLHEWGRALTRTGDHRGAAAALNEAVVLRRVLAADREEYRPDLAAALVSQAIALCDLGWYGNSSAASAEAIDIYRNLAAADLGYSSRLAMVLSNHGNTLTTAGGPEHAVNALKESVQLYSSLREPLAHAMALNNLSNALHGLGDHEEALAAAKAALAIRRAEYETHNESVRPDLALSLVGLSVHLADSGHLEGAVDAAEEATEHYRALSDANPTYQAGLGHALNNLAIHLGDTGDPERATAIGAEAVEVRVRLTRLAPAAHLRDLATSLNAQERRTGADLAAWEAVAAQLTGAQAAVLWTARHGDFATDLVRALTALGEGEDLEWTGHARRAINAAAALLPEDDRPDVPSWVLARVPEDLALAAARWSMADGWSEREALLCEESDSLLAAVDSGVLADAKLLYCDIEGFDEFASMLAELRRTGVEEGLAESKATWRRLELITAWMRTSTWDDSLRFALTHTGELFTAEVAAYLDLIWRESRDRDVLRHYLAVRLAGDDPGPDAVHRVFDWITDAELASEAAFEALSEGDIAAYEAISFLPERREAAGFAGMLHSVVAGALGGSVAEAVTHLRGQTEAYRGQPEADRRLSRYAAWLDTCAARLPEHAETLAELAAVLRETPGA